jgi:ABC-type phosphate/phosphonate transport system substrate-binding protein
LDVYLPVSLIVATLALTGCTSLESFSEDDPFILAFTMKDDHTNTDKDPQRLAAFLSERTGRDVELYDVTSAGAAIQALRFGHAHAAFLDGGAAWLAWQEYGIEAIAADQESDGRTHYVAQAWVRNNSDIMTLEQLEGRNSCHTGWLKSAGMLMPMGYLIKTDIADVVGDPDDILALETTINAFFDEATIPEEASPYYNYDGAFRCMTEGVGDVAFAKDTSYEDHCEGNDWCLPRDEYRKLEPAFGAVPSHPVMVSPDLPEDARTELQQALLALNDGPEGRAILVDVLETPGLTAVTTEGHLGDYSENLRHVPGLQAEYEADYDLDGAAQ